MDPIIQNAPANLLSRRAYFWRQVKLLKNQPGLSSNISYKNSNSRQMQNEYIRIKVREFRQNIAKQAVQSVQKRQIKNIAKQAAQLSQNRTTKILQRKELTSVKEFFNKPQKDELIELKNLSIREAVQYIKLYPNFVLLLNTGDKYYTINTNNYDTLIENMSNDIVQIENLNASDADLIAVVTNTDISANFIWRSAGRRRPNGGYFKYYNKLDKINLSRYGIYRNADETDKYIKNCLEIALVNAGIEESKFDKLKTIIKTRYIPQKDLIKIASHLDICIVLRKLNTRDNLTYGDKNKTKIEIGLIDEHYFLIEKTNYTSFSIKNYFEVCKINDFNKIYKKKSSKYEKINNRFITSYDLVKLLIENKETHLEDITMINCGIFSQYSNKVAEYINLPEITENEAILYEPRELSKPSIFLNKEKKYHPYEFLYFDTEATTDESIHKVYMINSIDRRGEKRSFDGKNCILNWLKSLTGNYVCIAHNLRYDFQFIVKYLEQASDIIKTGNKIKSISGKFYNQNTGKTILLHFKDSNGLISMPLKKFGECFNLDVKKEIMPYEIYNKDTINKKFIKFEQAQKFLSITDYDEFLKNINDWKLVQGQNFNHIEYARIYCYMDCQVLKNGYEIFKEWMNQITNLNIDDLVSIPQLANIFGINSDVFQGCYKISGVPRDFIQKCIVGGRCMVRNNNQFEINHNVDDFDGVSLYPSAMNRMDGFLLGLPKVWNEQIDLSKTDGYFLEINILNVKKYRDFPLLSRVNEKGVRIFSNDIRGSCIYVDKTTLEDLIKFQEVEYTILRGYFFNEGRNNKIKNFIKNLFDERAIKKKEENPIQELYKLIMNAFYGKLIMKPIEHNYSFVYGKDKFQKHLQYKFNSISQYTAITDGLFFVKENRSIMDHFSMPHGGVEVLSMSKRIMNEVMCLSEDIGIDIYYQDTDSMHIDARLDKNGKSGIQRLASEFSKIYNRDLVGKNLSQFDIDFDYKSTDTPAISVQSIYLGKKSYIDKVKTENNGVIDFHYHARCKGIPSTTLFDVVKNDFYGNAMNMYRKLLEHEPITFDLLKVCKFKINNNFTTSNNNEFKRTLIF